MTIDQELRDTWELSIRISERTRIALEQSEVLKKEQKAANDLAIVMVLLVCVTFLGILAGALGAWIGTLV